MSNESKHGLAALMIALLAAGCVTGGSHAGTQRSLNANSLGTQVLINRDTLVVSGQHSALDLLEGRVARFRLSSNEIGGAPLVVLDGVPLIDGIATLRLMRADDVHSIATMWPPAECPPMTMRSGSAPCRPPSRTIHASARRLSSTIVEIETSGHRS